MNFTFRHGCSPVNLLHIFWKPFPKNTSGRLLLTSTHFIFPTDLRKLKINYWHSRSVVGLNLSWRRPLSYRHQSIDLLRRSMDWFLYDNGLRHERVDMKALFSFNSYHVYTDKCFHDIWLVSPVLRQEIFSIVKSIWFFAMHLSMPAAKQRNYIVEAKASRALHTLFLILTSKDKIK